MVAASALLLSTSFLASLTNSSFATKDASRHQAWQPVSTTAGVPLTATEWADGLWSGAKNGLPKTVLNRLHDLPAEHADPDVVDLNGDIQTLFSNLDAQLDERIKSYHDALEELEQHLAEDDLRQALADALGAHEVSLAAHELLTSHERAHELKTQDAVLRDPQIVALVKTAETEAFRATQTGNWLHAQDLYYRLNALMNQSQRYEKDLARASRRIQLLSLYVPDRLHQLTNRHLESIGEEIRPNSDEGNRTPWQDRVAGINRTMVVESLDAAASDHLWSQGWKPLVSGGLDAIEVFLTTNDLKEAFPSLKNESQRKSMLKSIRAEKTRWENEARHERFGAFEVLRRLQRHNQGSVQLPQEVILREFTEGSMTSLDKFSSMIWPFDMSMFSRQLNGSYVGVGIQITLDEAYRLKVISPLEDSPAMTAGIRAGDVITAIDGKSTTGITVTRAITTITGKPNTNVVLTVERQGAEKNLDFVVRRRPIRIETIKGWRRKDGQKDWDYMIDPENKIGYIRLVQQFGPNTVSEFDRAIMDLRRQHVQGIILDVRFNPGGLLSQAVQLCNRFVEQGLIVETVDPRGNSEKFTARRHRAQDLDGVPLIVLVNEGAASASEIVAGCLRDHDRALLIGSRTYGKGSVQKVRRIAGDTARLRLTSEHYLIPSGRSIHRRPGKSIWGVDPHLEVRVTPEQIAATILLRQECDIIFDPNEEAPANAIIADRNKKQNEDGNDDDAAGDLAAVPAGPIDRNPDRLITEPGYDLQLQTALILLQSHELPDKARHAVLQSR